MKRNLAVLGVMAVLVGILVGCSSASTACEGKPNAVTVCVNGKPVDFSGVKNGPHRHEIGSIYAPVKVLGQALGVPIGVSLTAGGKSAAVSINGKAFEPMMPGGAKGIHIHDGEAFVPVKEFAAAIGMKLALDADKGTAGFAK